MATVTHSVRIEAPRAQVWSVLSDIGAISDWSPAVSHSVTTSGEPGGVGASRHCDLPGPLGATEETVTEWVEGERLSLDVAGARMLRSSNATFALEEAGAATDVTMTVNYEMAGGPLGPVMAAVMGNRMLGNTMQQTLDGLKQHVESAVTAGIAEAS
jgi:uncharacterized membrane protein